MPEQASVIAQIVDQEKSEQFRHLARMSSAFPNYDDGNEVYSYLHSAETNGQMQVVEC